jgi:hypothetical protein
MSLSKRKAVVDAGGGPEYLTGAAMLAAIAQMRVAAGPQPDEVATEVLVTALGIGPGTLRRRFERGRKAGHAGETRIITIGRNQVRFYRLSPAMLGFISGANVKG